MRRRVAGGRPLTEPGIDEPHDRGVKKRTRTFIIVVISLS